MSQPRLSDIRSICRKVCRAMIAIFSRILLHAGQTKKAITSTWYIYTYFALRMFEQLAAIFDDNNNNERFIDSCSESYFRLTHWQMIQYNETKPNIEVI
jgi:hypothetical protein